MPKGKKICKTCGQENGVRTKVCACGYVFAAPLSVPASGVSMTLDPLDERIADSVASARAIIDRVQSRPSQTFDKPAIQVVTPTKSLEQSRPVSYGKGRTTYVPRGDCRYKPEGFKDVKWKEGPASDAVVEEWALKVFNADGENTRFMPHAVVYQARYFWDINGPEFSRITALILKVLNPLFNGKDQDD